MNKCQSWLNQGIAVLLYVKGTRREKSFSTFVLVLADSVHVSVEGLWQIPPDGLPEAKKSLSCYVCHYDCKTNCADSSCVCEQHA